MRHIHINSGRLLQRHVSEGDYLLGLIHLDPKEKILGGVDYLLMLDNQQSFLLELPYEHQQTLSLELQNGSLDDILCSQTWRKTTEDSMRIVRLIKQFDDSNGWLVFGPKIDKKVSADKWWDVAHSYVFSIPEPITTRGEKATGLAREPIWPHPNGQLYTMSPNFPVLRKSLAQTSEFKVLAHTHAGFSKILNFKHKYVKAFYAHPFWADHAATSLEDGYKGYLHTLHTMGMTGEEKPLSSTEFAAREEVSQNAVKTLVEQMHAGEKLREADPLSLEDREHALTSSTDPIVCANAVFEALVDNAPNLVNAPAWDYMSLDHIVLCAVPALSFDHTDVIEKIAQKIVHSDCNAKEDFMIQLLRTAENMGKTSHATTIIQQYTPEKLTQNWESVAYTIIPSNPRSLRHWVGIYDKTMFENVLSYTLGSQEHEGKMTWSDKCQFIKEIVDNTAFDWDQNAVFNRANYIEPIPSLEQWEMLFSTLNVKPVAQKGLIGESQKSFEKYFEHVCALDQKQRINNALEDQNDPKKLSKKKI